MRHLDQELFDLTLTVGEALEWGKDFLRESAGEEAGVEARAILSGVLNCSFTMLHLNRDREISIDHVKKFKSLILRRSHFEPVAYLLGTKNFMGREFMVDQRVLIPRPETEILVEVALEILRIRNIQHPQILEIGTGSGCIGITLSFEFPAATVISTDVSDGALDVARMNADELRSPGNIHFLKSDLYRDLPSEHKKHFDMIISNPPYVLTSEMKTVAPDLQFEPRLALDGGDEGTSVLTPLIFEAPQVLKPKGILLTEIGYTQGAVTKNLFHTAGFQQIVVVKDFQDHDRIVKGELNHGSV